MLPSSIKVTIDGHEVNVPRARLGLFLHLEYHLSTLRKATEDRSSSRIVGAIHQYLELAAGQSIDMPTMTWIEFYSLFVEVRGLNTLPRDLPMLKGAGFRRRDPAPWDHPYRPRILWIHMIASTYGWARAEIEYLWPEDAAVYVQEILTDEQLQKEWEHMLSSVAHPVDKQGKDKYVKIARPAWMSPKPRKTKIPKRMLPMGHIINISGVEPEDIDDD